MSETGILQEDGEPLELPKTGAFIVPPTKGMFTAKEAKQAATETGLVAIKRKKYTDLKKLGDFIEKEGVVKTSIGYVFLSAEKLEPLMQLAADIAYEADDDAVKLQAISKAVEVSKQLTESAKICGNMVNNKQIKAEESRKKASFAPGQQITPIQINDPKQVEDPLTADQAKEAIKTTLSRLQQKPSTAFMATILSQALGLKTNMARKALKVKIENIILFDRKQSDYGSKNIAAWDKKDLNILGVGFRLNDKLQRMMNLTWKRIESKESPEVDDEPMLDTAKDIENYGTILELLESDEWS